MNLEIATSRLLLLPASRRHARDLHEATVESVPELACFLSWARPDISVHDTRAYLRRMEARRREGTGCAWLVTRREDGRALGQIELRFGEGIPVAEVGYWMRSSETGRGHMAEALGALVEFAFGRLSLHRIDLLAAVDNLASCRVAAKAGFVREGVLASARPDAAGHWHDVYIHGIVAPERPPGAVGEVIASRR